MVIMIFVRRLTLPLPPVPCRLLPAMLPTMGGYPLHKIYFWLRDLLKKQSGKKQQRMINEPGAGNPLNSHGTYTRW